MFLHAPFHGEPSLATAAINFSKVFQFYFTLSLPDTFVDDKSCIFFFICDCKVCKIQQFSENPTCPYFGHAICPIPILPNPTKPDNKAAPFYVEK